MKKILIIEDDLKIAELERDYLEANQYQVDMCNNGCAGIEKVLHGDYQLIILDLMLPLMDGFEVCRQIKEKQNIPIFIVSACDAHQDILKGLSLGATDYIVKPFDPKELVERVNILLQ